MYPLDFPTSISTTSIPNTYNLQWCFTTQPLVPSAEVCNSLDTIFFSAVLVVPPQIQVKQLNAVWVDKNGLPPQPKWVQNNQLLGYESSEFGYETTSKPHNLHTQLNCPVLHSITCTQTFASVTKWFPRPSS